MRWSPLFRQLATKVGLAIERSVFVAMEGTQEAPYGALAATAVDLTGLLWDNIRRDAELVRRTHAGVGAVRNEINFTVATDKFNKEVFGSRTQFWARPGTWRFWHLHRL